MLINLFKIIIVLVANAALTIQNEISKISTRLKEKIGMIGI